MLTQIVYEAIKNRDAELLRIALKDTHTDEDWDYIQTELDNMDDEYLQKLKDEQNRIPQDTLRVEIAEGDDEPDEVGYYNQKYNINQMVGPGCEESTWTGTFLHAAVSTGRLDLVQLLIDADADVNLQVELAEPSPTTSLPSIAPLQSRAGDTPLHIAATKNMEKLAPNPVTEFYDPGFFKQPGALFKRGTDLDQYYEIIQSLLKAGADPNITNSEGDTPRDLAVRFNNQDLVAILDNFAANRPQQ